MVRPTQKLSHVFQPKQGSLERPPNASTLKTSRGPADKEGGGPPRTPPVIRPLVQAMECCNVSNALRKSREMTITNGLARSMLVMALRRQIIGAVGEPVYRNANWLGNNKVEGGARKVG